MMLDNMETKRRMSGGHTYLQWTFSLFANIPLFLYGIESGWISPISKCLQSDNSPTGYPVSDEALNWIVSSMSFAAIFGVPVYAYIADAFGRRLGVILLALPQAISWIIRLSYSSTTTLIIARIISGLASGGCFNIVPIYVKEISQDNIRGTLGTLSTLLQTLGVLLTFIIGAYLDYFTMNCIIMIFPILAILLMLKAPESPAYLVKRGQIDDAINAVALLRGLSKDDKDVLSIVDGMKKEEDYFQSLPKITLLNILRRKSWRIAFILSMLTFTFFELNGAIVIVTYASTILSSTGVEFNVRPEIQALSFPIVMILGSLMVATCVERVGRKPLLIIAFLVSSGSMFCMAIMMLIEINGGSAPDWLPVLVMILCVFMYSGGVLPLSYIMMTEMFSFQIRAKLVGLVITYAWFLTFWVFHIHALLSNNLGKYSAFLFYGLINLAGAVFAFIWLTETKGKTEEEILKTIVKGTRSKRDHIETPSDI
ncbi:facilitated trehalose transporter Tret1-like [Maniola jurtina]|uniref:facilitated trehalose transporter Tret1-like n=1 Tax=Maniola jurtina TaxID=191418 RepID=UPI001E6882CB|nr:facilitated trehalose transporter Tret1-like [Maniola jurtina]